VRALVLGRGQVGRALASSVPDHVDVLVFGRSECDIGDAAQIARAIAVARPDVVLNAAGHTAVDRAEARIEQARRLNGVAPGLIAAEARRVGARTVHISTDFVFDGAASRPYRPEDPTGPLSVYGTTKLEGERAALAADPATLIVRTAWVHSARAHNFVTAMLRAMNRNERVTVVADQVGTPTHADSLARALWALVAQGRAGLHHYTDAGVASWYDFAVAIAEDAHALGLLRRKIEVVPIGTEDYPAPAKRPAYSVLDKSATWSLIGAIPPHWRVNLRTALQELKVDG